MTIGEEIKRLRKSKGLTMVQLSELTSVSQGFLSHIEVGKRNATPETLSNIAVGLGVSKLHLYRAAGLLDDTDILALVDENKRLRESLQRACDSLGADIEDYL